MSTNCVQIMGGGGGGWMMIGAGVIWLLIVTILVRAIAALLKYLRSGPG